MLFDTLSPVYSSRVSVNEAIYIPLEYDTVYIKSVLLKKGIETCPRLLNTDSKQLTAGV